MNKREFQFILLGWQNSWVMTLHVNEPTYNTTTHWNISRYTNRVVSFPRIIVWMLLLLLLKPVNFLRRHHKVFLFLAGCFYRKTHQYSRQLATIKSKPNKDKENKMTNATKYFYRSLHPLLKINYLTASVSFGLTSIIHHQLGSLFYFCCFKWFLYPVRR